MRVEKSAIVQNLAVLSAQIVRGTLIKPGEPNFALLSQAAQTIHRFLDTVNDDEGRDGSNNALHFEKSPQELELGTSSLLPTFSFDLVDSESVFWQGLTEHLSLEMPFPPPTNLSLYGHGDTECL